MTNQFFVIDLFSGCGGSAWGFKVAGFAIKAAVEIDKIASESFSENFPETTIINDDIRRVTGKYLLKSSGIKSGDRNRLIILACPPCQGFSTARRNEQRQTDPRNILILEFVRLVKEIKPIAFVLENVPGLAKGIGQSVFQDAINQLSDIGYRMTDPKVLEAADYGVPQKRRRLVVIGTRVKGLRLTLPEPTHQRPNSTDRKLPPWKTVRDTIFKLPRISAGARNTGDSLHITASLSELNLERLKNTPKDGGSRMAWPEQLKLKCHKSVTGYTDVYGRMHWDSPSSTITGGCAMISKGRFGHPEQNRAISLREAAKFQTFPDSFNFTGNFGEIAKQIGNAVPSLLAQKIAEALRQSLIEYLERAEKPSDGKLLRTGSFNTFAYLQ